MMKKVETASGYHLNTAYDRYQMGAHSLDWQNQPDIYKNYSSADTVPLMKPDHLPDISLWKAYKKTSLKKDPVIGLKRLSKILALSYSFTAKQTQMGQTFFYRTAASAGALYPAEIYVALFTENNISPGLYHYSIKNFSLNCIRKENLKNFVKNSINSDKHKNILATFFITGIFFRSSWKYRKRAFRYVLLDTGHLLENLVLALTGMDLKCTVHYDYNDDKMNRLIGLDSKREVCLACVNVIQDTPYDVFSESNQSLDIKDLDLKIKDASQVSKKEIFYEEISTIHQASKMIPGSTFLDESSYHVTRIFPKTWIRIKTSDDFKPKRNMTESILLRRSKRNYIPETMSNESFMAMIDLISLLYDRNLSAVYPYLSGLNIGLLAGAVEGIDKGFYLFDPEKKRLGMVLKGFYSEKMAVACMNQMWLGAAGIQYLFMANLEHTDSLWHARGYRYQMINAGRIGQLIYLAATALELGACGIGAFFDNESNRILDLNDKSTLLYLVAAGPVKK